MEFLRKHFTALQQMNFSTGVYIMTLEKAKTMYKIKPSGRKKNYKEFPPEMMECLQLSSSVFSFTIYLIIKGPLQQPEFYFEALHSGCYEFHWQKAVTFSKCEERSIPKRCPGPKTQSSKYRQGGLFFLAGGFLEVGVTYWRAEPTIKS